MTLNETTWAKQTVRKSNETNIVQGSVHQICRQTWFLQRKNILQRDIKVGKCELSLFFLNN